MPNLDFRGTIIAGSFFAVGSMAGVIAVVHPDTGIILAAGVIGAYLAEKLLRTAC